MVSFEGNCKGQEIEVELYYGVKTVLIKRVRAYKDRFSVFCPKAGNDYGSLSRKKVRLEGNGVGVAGGVRQFTA